MDLHETYRDGRGTSGMIPIEIGVSPKSNMAATAAILKKKLKTKKNQNNIFPLHNLLT